MAFQAKCITILVSISIWNSAYAVTINKENALVNKTFLQNRLKDSSSSCGGKLTANEGTISYKAFIQYAPVERCVWIVRAPNATSYNVKLDNLGTRQTLQVSGFGLPGSETHILPTAAANISVPNSNVLVITFFTDSANNTNNYRGFSLRYTASTVDSNAKASATSEDVIVPANIGHIKYPSLGNLYGNFDLSIIVVEPSAGSIISGKTTELIYIKSGLEGQSCQDRLSIYTLDRSVSSSTNKWRLLGSLCGGVDSEVISSRDLILIKFESDFTAASTGFHLYSRVSD